MPDRAEPANRILLVTAHHARFQSAAFVIAEMPAQWSLEWARTPVEAVRRLLRGSWRLVCIDASIDERGGRALVFHLARWRPELPVIVLSDDRPEGGGPGSLASHSSWTELGATLNCRLTARPTRGGQRDR